jgi:hypothetical protein
MDWVPVSAALLLTGALALSLGAFLLPSSDSTAETLRIVEQQGGQWLAAAAVFFLSSICLTLGMPAILALFTGRGWTLGVISVIVLSFGFIGTAGFAMLMAFVRSLVVSDALRAGGLDAAGKETGLVVFLYVWIAGLYLGELLLGLALLRGGCTPRWIPAALILHVLTFPLGNVLPDALSKATILLLLVGFAGVAIQASSPETRRRFS